MCNGIANEETMLDRVGVDDTHCVIYGENAEKKRKMKKKKCAREESIWKIRRETI